jgi:TRAP-type C4-dicarboxylate transport system permease small subunit
LSRLLKAVTGAYNVLIVGLAVVAGAAIAAAFVVIVVDVGIRAAGWRPPAFTSAVVEYILLYFTLFAAPWLVRRKAHVYVDAVVSRLPGGARWSAEKLAYLVCIATCLTFSYIGFGLTVDAIRAGGFEERSVDVPLWINYAPMAPSFLLVALEFGRYLVGVDTMYVDRTRAPDSL